MNLEDFSIINKTKTNPPISGLVFRKIKDTIMGKNYTLSVVFVGEKKIRDLNKKYRNKDKATDILSFQISESEGEIFLNQKMAEKKAKIFDRKIDNFLKFLFVHGLIHLKGMEHGSKMDKEEEKFRKKFNI